MVFTRREIKAWPEEEILMRRGTLVNLKEVVVGIDNGVTGTIAILDRRGNVIHFDKIPTFKEQNYTKKKGNVTRIAGGQLKDILSMHGVKPVFAYYERPMVNPTRFQATLSAIRALEATLTIIELLQIPYDYIDSKEWQKVMLPNGIKGEADLKKASVDICKRLFPTQHEFAVKHGDADGLLIAEYLRRERK
jgi:hypothetical protein